ncbi:MAG TPA: hypothetical protein VFQ65_08160 [Kofleriaceae bacterium]|nr:hypothetical protein [Kofleriaceae bacterium]
MTNRRIPSVRSAGSFANNFATTRANHRGTSGRFVRTSGGCSPTCSAATVIADPANTVSPASISNSTHPSA